MHGEAGGEFIDEDQQEIRKLANDLGLTETRVLRGGFSHYRLDSNGGDACGRHPVDGNRQHEHLNASFTSINLPEKNGADRSPGQSPHVRLLTGCTE